MCPRWRSLQPVGYWWMVKSIHIRRKPCFSYLQGARKLNVDRARVAWSTLTRFIFPLPFIRSSLNDPHALGEDIIYIIMRALAQWMGATMCVAVLALPHPTPQPLKPGQFFALTWFIKLNFKIGIHYFSVCVSKDYCEQIGQKVHTPY